MGGAGAVCQCHSRGVQAALARLEYEHEGRLPFSEGVFLPIAASSVSMQQGSHTLSWAPLCAEHVQQIQRHNLHISCAYLLGSYALGSGSSAVAGMPKNVQVSISIVVPDLVKAMHAGSCGWVGSGHKGGRADGILEETRIHTLQGPSGIQTCDKFVHS